MGAVNFYYTSSGANPLEAFRNAVKSARYEYGHRGYTGTIAEKASFTMATDKLLSKKEAFNLADSLIDSKYSEKWGPAGCIPIVQSSCLQEFLFFGWASE